MLIGPLLYFEKSEADLDRGFHFSHGRGIQRAQTLDEPFPVDRTNLVQMNRRGYGQAVRSGWRYDHLDRIRRVRQFRGDGRHNGDRTELVFQCRSESQPLAGSFLFHALAWGQTQPDRCRRTAEPSWPFCFVRFLLLPGTPHLDRRFFFQRKPLDGKRETLVAIRSIPRFELLAEGFSPLGLYIMQDGLRNEGGTGSLSCCPVEDTHGLVGKHNIDAFAHVGWWFVYRHLKHTHLPCVCQTFDEYGIYKGDGNRRSADLPQFFRDFSLFPSAPRPRLILPLFHPLQDR